MTGSLQANVHSTRTFISLESHPFLYQRYKAHSLCQVLQIQKAQICWRTQAHEQLEASLSKIMNKKIRYESEYLFRMRKAMK